MKLAVRLGHKISARLLVSFAVVLILMVGSSYSSLTAISRLGMSLDRAVNANARKLQVVGEIHTSVEEMRADSTKVDMSLVNMLVGRLDTKDGGAGESDCSSCHTKEIVDSQKQRFDDAARRLRQKIVELRPLVATDGERQATGMIDAGVVQWLALYEQYMTLVRGHRFVAGHEIMLGKIYPLIDSLAKIADQLAAAQEGLLSAASEEAKWRVDSSRSMAFTLLGLCVIAGWGVWWAVRGVARTLRIHTRELRDATHQVAAAASQISSSSQTLSDGAREQASSLQETSASSEQINIMSHKCAEGSRIASEKMQEAARGVNEANQSLKQMVGSMDAINASSGKIAQIIKVIDAIAFQTNILALNAAVEAARAGEAGMGFAVVADEVRNLAQRCAQAARDTAGLIENSIAMSTDGRGKFDQVTRAIRSITESTEQAKSLVDGVSQSSEQQTIGVEQIARAIAQVERVTESNAANAEENAAAGVELQTQSETLKHVVEMLIELV